MRTYAPHHAVQSSRMRNLRVVASQRINTTHLRADPRKGRGRIRYRRLPCAFDVLWLSLNKNYDITRCKYAEIFGDRNQWHLIDTKPLISSERTSQAARIQVMRRADSVLQEETDAFLQSIKDSVDDGRPTPTHAMQDEDEDGNDDVWLGPR